MTRPLYDIGSTVVVNETGTTRALRLAGKTVRIVERQGNGFYTVRTPRGRREYTLRAGVHF